MNFEISKITEAALKECRSNNIPLTDENIIIIYEFGKRADEPKDNILKYFGGVKVGNIRIYPLTIGAKLWLENEAKELCEFDENLYSQAILYAMINTNDLDKFNLESKKEFIKEMRRISRKCNFTQEELLDAMDKCEITDVFNDDKKEESKDKKEIKTKNISPTLSYLINTFGKDIKYWLWEVPELVCLTLINGFQDINGKKITSTNDKSLRAYFELRKYVENLKKINKDKQNV